MKISAAAESMIGPSHEREGTPNEDAHGYDLQFGAQGALTWGVVLDGHSDNNAITGLAVNQLPLEFKRARANGRSPENAMTTAFLAVDEQTRGLRGGACATALCLDLPTRSLVVAGVGDVRALLVTSRGHRQLTIDHRASNANEARRVKKVGSVIVGSYLAYGNYMLQVTRSLGDWDMKNGGVIATPTVRTIGLPDPPFWIVVANDGIWDGATNHMVARRVRQHIDPAEVVYQLLLLATMRGSRDDKAALVFSCLGD